LSAFGWRVRLCWGFVERNCKLVNSAVTVAVTGYNTLQLILFRPVANRSFIGDRRFALRICSDRGNDRLESLCGIRWLQRGKG
jgi:hypothetical protein